jgi:hypothetical protein
MTEFDYGAHSELFCARIRRSGRSMEYRRFAHASEAVRFAIEDLPAELLAGACLEVDEVRYGRNEIRHLYESTDYPLTRRAGTKRDARVAQGGTSVE